MTDPAILLGVIRRPRILIRAARSGITDYQRERDLKRLLRLNKAARAELSLSTLLDEEARLEHKRLTSEATYSIQRHVAILTALLVEARRHASAPLVAFAA
jgi:hypothetical protein